MWIDRNSLVQYHQLLLLLLLTPQKAMVGALPLALDSLIPEEQGCLEMNSLRLAFAENSSFCDPPW